MDRISLSKILEETTYLVQVIMNHEDHEPELISTGSAFCINNLGYLMTAAHVVTGRTPIRQMDVEDPNVEIGAKTKDGIFQRYVPFLTGFGLNLPGYLKEPIIVDIAILKPLKSSENSNFLKLANMKPYVGSEVLMAGFPDDMELPLSIDRFLNTEHEQVRGQKRNIELAKNLMMIRSGIVGHCSGLKLVDQNIDAWSLYIDNVLHSGASGGPIINMEGEVIGVITERAVTSVSYKETPGLKVPSGSTSAISPNLGTGFLKHNGISMEIV
jgi:hypothetical protein